MSGWAASRRDSRGRLRRRVVAVAATAAVAFGAGRVAVAQTGSAAARGDPRTPGGTAATAAGGTPGAANASDSLVGPLIISSAGSMREALTAILAAFTRLHPRIEPQLTTGGSVAAARRVADSTTVPDCFVSADDTLIDALLMPRYASWSAAFARSVMVLAYTDASRYADEISARNWVEVLTRASVHGARADPSQDPGAYRAIMLFELAARYYMRPDLVSALEHTVRITDFGPGGSRLHTLFATGAIDYMPIYRPSAAERGLRWVELPPQVNLGDTAFAASYAAVSVRIPAGTPGAPDSVTIRGAPIRYGLTVPRAARHSAAALAFARFVLSRAGQTVLRNAGFDPLEHPVLRGTPPAGLLDP